MVIETLKTDINRELSEKIKSMLHRAYEGDFSEEDWEHTLGGVRYLGWIGDSLIANGSICSRTIWLNDIEIYVGYIEAIAVEPKFWSKGYGTQLMQLISIDTLSAYSVSMLFTSEKGFYRQVGWTDFRGESFVKLSDKEVRTANDDQGLMFLGSDADYLTRIIKVVYESRSLNTVGSSIDLSKFVISDF
jgi:aminoglycoside 2'-N-acetyltransferase I